MACARGNCPGVPICNTLDICCIQIQQDCGDGCNGLLDGFSRIQVDATGALVICSNVGGACTCVPLGGIVGHTVNATAPPDATTCAGAAGNGGTWTVGQSMYIIPAGTVNPDSATGDTFIQDQVYELVEDCEWCLQCGDPEFSYIDLTGTNTLADGVLTTLTLGNTLNDTNGFPDGVGFTIPEDGYYIIEGETTFEEFVLSAGAIPEPPLARSRFYGVTVNGAIIASGGGGEHSVDRSIRVSFQATRRLAAGDIVRAVGLYTDTINPGAAFNFPVVSLSVIGARTWMTISKVRG